MRTIGITGGAGFIGLYLAKFFSQKKGYKIIIVDNLVRSNQNKKLIKKIKNIQFLKTDVRDLNKLTKNLSNCNFVIHLAAINGTDNFYKIPYEVIDVASKGIINVVSACKINKIKNLLVASSSEVYNNPLRVPTNESVPLIIPDIINPRFSYSAGKIFSELYSLHYASKFIKRVIIFRPHNVYGPNMGKKHVIPEIIMKLLNANNNIKNKKNIIQIKGNGKQIRSFIFIDDFAKAVEILILKGKTGVYNIGNTEPISIVKLISIIADKLNIKSKTSYLAKPKGDVNKRVPDIKKIKELGFRNKINLSKGLDITLSWYLSNYKYLKKEKNNLI